MSIDNGSLDVPVSRPERLFIKGLHGRQDISLVFAGSTTIFIADNGSGKTTALYILQCLLSGRFALLNRFKYDEIVLKFFGQEEFVIKQKDIAISRSVRAIRRIAKESGVTKEQIFALVNQSRQVSYAHLRETSQLATVARAMRTSVLSLYRRLQDIDPPEL